MKTTNVQIILLISLSILSLFIKLFALKHVLLYFSSDSAIYSILSQRFASGDFLHAMHLWWSPVYPLVSALFFKVSGDIANSMLFVSLLSISLLVIPIYMIIFDLTQNRYFSLVASFMTSLNEVLTFSSISLLSEHIYVFLIVSSIALTYKFIKSGSSLILISSGLLFGISFLTRSEGLLIYLLSLVFISICSLVKKGVKGMLVNSFCITVPFVVVLLPYLTFNSHVSGELNLSAKTNAAFKMGAPFALDENHETFAQNVWSVDTPNYKSHYFTEKYSFTKHVESFLSDSVIRGGTYISNFFKSTNVILQILLGIGIISTLAKIKKIQSIYLILILSFGFLISLIFLPQAEPRYIFWLYPFGELLIFFGAYQLFRFPNKVQNNILITFLLIVSLVSSYKQVATLSQIQENEVFGKSYKLAGEKIKQQGVKNPRIMTRIEAVTLYADGVTIYTPTGVNVETLIGYAKMNKVDFVVGNKLMFMADSDLSTLLDDSQNFVGLIKLASLHDSLDTVIYKVDK